MKRYKIVGKQYGKLAVILAEKPSEALTTFLSWFTAPDGPQLKRTGDTTARYADGEEVMVKAA